jgi:hypothetical protein
MPMALQTQRNGRVKISEANACRMVSNGTFRCMWKLVLRNDVHMMVGESHVEWDQYVNLSTSTHHHHQSHQSRQSHSKIWLSCHECHGIVFLFSPLSALVVGTTVKE